MFVLKITQRQKLNYMKQITPFLWFDDNAEEAVNFYTSIFKNSKIKSVTRYNESAAKVAGRPKDSLMTAAFELNGQEFVALNGGPLFKFTEAVSFVINCENQKEVDYYWEKLTSGADAKAQQCGWLKDKYGLSWQVVPTVLSELLADKNANKSHAVMTAMLQMKKIEIAALEKAHREG
jgi:predicted 3-demethylubiquinone-9 3-methyltransferase (glyoxalase superfamily)